MTVSTCAGTCDETCGDVEPPADGYNIIFNIDGIDDCGFVSVTGTFDDWSGWGAHTDNNMSIELDDGSYEFVILCVNTEGEWWSDIWSNSMIINAPIGSECDFDPSDE